MRGFGGLLGFGAEVGVSVGGGFVYRGRKHIAGYGRCVSDLDQPPILPALLIAIPLLPDALFG